MQEAYSIKGEDNDNPPQVFWLNVGILLHAEYLLLLMKQQIDQSLTSDQLCQAFLTWVSQKSRAVPVNYKSVTVRAFYFDLALTRVMALVGGTFNLARAFEHTLTCNLERPLALDLALDRALALEQVVELTSNPNLVTERVLERAIAHALAVDPRLEQALQQLKQQLPDVSGDLNTFKQWWSAHGQAWTEQLRAVMIEYRDIGHDWQLSNQQMEALLQYYDANSILVDCLNSYCDVTITVREEIELTLLLPIAEMRVGIMAVE